MACPTSESPAGERGRWSRLTPSVHGTPGHPPPAVNITTRWAGRAPQHVIHGQAMPALGRHLAATNTSWSKNIRAGQRGHEKEDPGDLTMPEARPARGRLDHRHRLAAHSVPRDDENRSSPAPRRDPSTWRAEKPCVGDAAQRDRYEGASSQGTYSNGAATRRPRPHR